MITLDENILRSYGGLIYFIQMRMKTMIIII